VTFSAGRSEQSFEVSALRDSSSNDYTVTVNFDPAALLKGSASFGYTTFRPAERDVPEYNGTTAGVNLAYTLLGSAWTRASRAASDSPTK
jgi:hypothetical protein